MHILLASTSLARTPARFIRASASSPRPLAATSVVFLRPASSAPSQRKMEGVKPGVTRIGWVGTGVMGKSMVGHLMAAGYSATVYNRTAR
jgi:3-hydroxyisobutyrate dehydrogenase